MADFNSSTNMNLPIPIVGQDLGPDWALNNNNCLTLVDGHDHSIGKGVQITPSGLNINTDLPLNNSNLTTIKSLRFTPQSSLPAVAPNLACLFVIGADIYYNDGNGNQIRFTQGGSLAGASGTITGLPSGTASASYNAISGTFIFQSASNVAANIDGASLIIREQVASAKGVTLASPTALAADYSITFPGALPVTQKILTLDNSGSLVAAYTIDGVTLEIAAGVIQVKAMGIGTAQIADAAVTTIKIADMNVTTAKIADANVTTVKIADANVTRPKLVAVGQQISSSCGAFTIATTTHTDVTNLSRTITTSGRPVIIMMQPTGLSASEITIQANTSVAIGFIQIVVGSSTVLAQWQVATRAAGSTLVLASTPSCPMFMDTPVAGTYTYKIRAFVNAGINAETLSITQYELVVYEL